MGIKKYASFLLFFIVLSVSSQEWKQNFKIVEPIRARENDFGCAVATYNGYAAYGADLVDINGVENAGKVYIAKQDCNGWTIYQEIIRPDSRSYCGFGHTLFMGDKILAIGGCDPDVTNGIASAVYIYERNSSDQYVFIQKIKRVENSIYENFNPTIAISGNFMVLGSYYNSTDSNYNNYLEYAGAAYIFFRGDDGVWRLVQKIGASDRKRGDNFGNSVAIYENTIVVGANREGSNWAGAAYVFEKNANSITWREVKKITAYDFRGLQDRFGEIVRINENGIMISAPGDDDYDSSLSGDGGGPLTMLGSVYIFRKNTSGEWTGHQKIRASDGSASIFNFGNKMEIYKDQIAVRSTEYEYDALGNLSKAFGRVYMFKKGTNNLWSEYQIVQSNIKRNSDWFGGTISLYEDDLFVGAFWDGLDSNGENYIGYAGTAYIFNTYDYVNSQRPILNPIPVLTSCADLGNGFSSSFNMSNIENDLVETPQNFIFTYTDKNGNKLPSPLPDNYSNSEPFSEKINVRVANKNNPSCYEESEIKLETVPSFTLNSVPDLEKCDSQGTGFAEFDLSKISAVLVNDPSLFTFKYFNKNGVDITSSINGYKNSTKNFEEITVDVTNINTSCSAKSTVKLIVANIDSDCETEEPEEPESYIIPKFFTPNADGFNDTWEITGINDQNYSIHIFDRYGRLLKVLGKNGSWDGNYNGTPLPSSDYWFQLILENGSTQKGHFSLKR
ncbi:T9SS type B sorting domain-containing protein [Flavobacterium johnsoniae]|uniref:Gliding motility-associated C-terminal domain-containing protein n=1 Tax=Flavobacterium johnsoniae TaxID=986 RepID=A0A1M5NX14_FLAJO|nr:T9SS type B sorting domain-containing protein [Flavobacterium johnsoniae]SHG93523.1 gliding motility-associated C-terminal domain-containing protein [Flavobacterium johnsoniae]